jgi:VIT1/CCC1 family predicted Fe2+/Mn2+ transporter
MTTFSALLTQPSGTERRLSAGGLNRLRAGVLGANDGIVSVAAIVVGVAGASSSRVAVLTAGVAGLVAGALSMAAGEYVSVSSQRDAERAAHVPPAQQTDPWHAALASLVAFVVGGLVPMLVALVPWAHAAVVPAIAAGVVLALVVTGAVSARVSGADPRRAVVRNVTGGSVAMAVTYGIGMLVGLAL